MPRPLIVILGCGWIARRHAAAARRFSANLDLAFASRSGTRARAYAPPCGVVAAFHRAGGLLPRDRLRVPLMPVERISAHVWWLPPGPPDRPSLCAVVGERWTLALDAGSSRAHTREFLAGLPQRPAAVAYTHSH